MFVTIFRFRAARLLALFFVLSFNSLVFAQTPAASPNAFTPAQLVDLERLKQAALDSDFALRQTDYLTNNIGARLSGSAQAANAVEYVAAQMRELGFDVQLEKVTVPHWVRGVETGELVQYRGQARSAKQKIVLTALGGSVATAPEGLTAEVVAVQSFDELNRLGREKVAGKIVLFDVPFDRRLAAQGFAGVAYRQAVAYRGGGASAAARLGAVAALVRSVGGAEYRVPHTGALNYAPDAAKIPAAAVAAEDANLISKLAAQGTVKMRLVLTPQTLPDAESYNVIADLKGSQNPEQIVIVSGHLDSWDLGTGAIDDASGVAAAMSVLKTIKDLNLRPKRTVRFVAWMNEENGLRGARAYAENQKNNVANHIAAIEMDGGPGHPAGFSAHATDKTIAALQPLARILSGIGAGAIEQSQNAEGADISPLDAAGVPTFAPLSDNRTYFDYHHTPADTFDKVGKRELAENSAVLTVLAFALADMNEPIEKLK